MIPGREEILRSVYGAWRLANLDASGMRWLELTAEGFFNSFFAAVLLAPFYAVLVMSRQPAGAEVSLPIEAMAYIAGWIAFPLIMIPLCRGLGLGQNYVPYIVAYNWSQTMVMALWLPLTLLAAGGVVGSDLGNLLLLIGLVAVFYYLWFVTRTALQTSGLTAAGIVIVEYLTSLLVHSLFLRL